jgi:SAM-dependent methyltransferase
METNAVAVSAISSPKPPELKMKRSSLVKYFESELQKLVAGITPGVDPVLDAYRESKSGDSSYSTSLNRQVRAFLLYRKYAETGTRFLDWGCRHAWDSCMVRMVNSRATIDGCDITETMAETPKQFARMNYTKLDHPSKLPFADGAFDRVISSGVLEHAPLLSPSLLELNRIIESDGYLIITFLPNEFSYTEFTFRNIFKRGYHRRLFSKSRLRKVLVDHGFDPVEIGHHQLLPSLITGHRVLRSFWVGSLLRGMFKLDPIAERIWPLKIFSPNLYAIARKRDYM